MFRSIPEKARLFAVKRCARCQRGIFANELVMRARDLVYHLHCFTCAWCNTALTQGDYFGLRDNLVYCRGHYELMMHGESFLPNGTEGTALLPRYPGLALCSAVRNSAPRTEPSLTQVTGTNEEGRPRKGKTTDAVVREDCSRRHSVSIHHSALLRLSILSWDCGSTAVQWQLRTYH
ncbi:LIM/homeobox protein Lhx9 [Araneus ventricosus]|uniref:LIM/homeobox protein Lhx9 n=1 Tax=Araneus ventricosus TaxID=182803 RepID=A0A4Y2QI85_ARAVE|nr:LIM/homeobox protein Lhx9 [Araneus ventricosus]